MKPRQVGASFESQTKQRRQALLEPTHRDPTDATATPSRPPQILYQALLRCYVDAHQRRSGSFCLKCVITRPMGFYDRKANVTLSRPRLAAAALAILIVVAGCSQERQPVASFTAGPALNDSRVVLQFAGPVSPKGTVRLDIQMNDGASYTWGGNVVVQRREHSRWVDTWVLEAAPVDASARGASFYRAGHDPDPPAAFDMGTAWFGGGFQTLRIPPLTPGLYRAAKSFRDEHQSGAAYVEFNVRARV